MIGSAEVLVARMASSGDDVVELLEERDLRRKLLDDRLDAEIALRKILEARGEGQQAVDPLDVLVAELPGFAAALERRTHPALTGGQLLGSRLGDQGPDAVAGTHFSDPRAHQPGADDPHAPDLHGRHSSEAAVV